MKNFDVVKHNRIKVEINGREKEFDGLESFLSFLDLPNEILDETEKKYIKTVVRPFWKNVVGVRKYCCFDNTEFISITYIDNAYIDNAKGGRYEMTFPSFKKGTMYANMKTGAIYTLNELGINFEK